MTRTKTAPFVRQGVSSMAISMDVLLAGLVLLAMSYLYYGWRPVLLGLIGGVSSLGAQILVSLLLSHHLPARPVSAAAYGLTVALLLPPSAPYWMPVAGGVFATAVACVPLGGEGHSPFHPAAAGASFLTICFAEQMFAYPAPRAPMTNFLPLGDTASVIAGTSPASVMKNGVSPLTTLTEAVTGQAAGAIGAVFILIIAALVQLVEIVLRKYIPSLYNALGIYLPLITTNCAVLGVTMLVLEKGAADPTFGYLQSLVNAFGSGIGFLVAMVIFAGVRQKMEACDIPETMKGLPITLVAASLVAVSFLGFQGLVDGLLG